MNALLAAIIITLVQVVTAAVPPDACFQDFRWEDCGKEPKAVMYYWKPGSRCEVGIWRGCRPSFNMFKDEYECVSTCIFTVRAHADDFHNLQNLEETPVPEYDSETDSDDKIDENSTDTNATSENINSTDNKNGSDDNQGNSSSSDTTDGSNASKTDNDNPTATTEMPTTTPAA